jgi:hypothetical protein
MSSDLVTAFRKELYGRLTLGPLEPTDPQYVPLYELPELRNDDPVQLLRFAIEATETPTAQLVSGFRGTGKSTELRRLRRELLLAGHRVVLCDIEDYLNTGSALDPVDFLYALALAVAGTVMEETGDDSLREGYATRLWNFLAHTQVDLPELNVGVKAGGDLDGVKLEASAGAKLVLKDHPSFRERARTRWKGSLGALTREVHQFIREIADTLRPNGDAACQVVVIVDSVEHIQGTLSDAAAVQASVEKLFTAHADLLHIPGIHTVYTVHPYLKIKYANIDDYYPFGGLQIIPTLKVRERASGPVLGAPRSHALQAIEQVVQHRGRWQTLLGEDDIGRDLLHELILLSGGHLRDLIRMLAEIVRRTRALPASREVFDAAVNHVRNQALPIADDDALWLSEIAQSHATCLPSEDQIPSLARFLDTHRVLCYRNGSEWFDVHPLIRPSVLEQAAAVRARRATPTS